MGGLLQTNSIALLPPFHPSSPPPISRRGFLYVHTSSQSSYQREGSGTNPLPSMATPSSASQPLAQGSCKVSDSQVAFMVECYLRDRQFTKTLGQFRAEAASILQPLKTVPKSARSLSAVLNEYVVLKEHQIALNQEKARADVLFKGLQEVLSAYTSGNQTIFNQSLPILPNPAPSPHSCPSDQIASISSPFVEVATKEQRTSSTLCKRKRNNECNNGLTEVASNSLKLSNGDSYNTAEAAKKPRCSSISSSAQSSYLSTRQGQPFLSNDQNLRTNHSVKPSVIQPATPPMKAEHISLHQQASVVPLTPSSLPYAFEKSSPDPACSQGISITNNDKTNTSIMRNQTPMMDDSKSMASRMVGKRGYNKKCKLLDFSSCPKTITRIADNLPRQNTHQINTTACEHPNEKTSPACYIEAFSSPPLPSLSTSSLQSCDAQTDVDVETSTVAQDMLPFPSSDIFSCDGIFLDDLLDVELDTDLLSQLEDLQAIRDMKGLIDVPGSPTQLLTRDENSAKLCSSKSCSPRGSVLTEKGNILENCKVQLEPIQAQGTGTNSYSLTSPNFSKSPRKHGSSISESKNKENMPMLASLPSIQA